MIYYLRKIFQKYKKCKGESLIKSIKNEISISQFNFFVSNAIITKSPLMISRFGSEEIKWYLNYKVSRYGKMQRAWYYIINEVDVWRDVTKMRLIKNLSFVPSTEEMSKTFFEEYTTAIPKIDILGSWLYLEKSQLISLNAKTRSIYLGYLEPYFSDNPWSLALAEKRVLVIHPMKKSIESQYLKRKLIFGNKQILPDFHLEVLQAPYFDDPRFGSWQAIMDFYKSEVLNYDFDVAILGCGSWGMPLAGYIKDMGKVAIHLGGATQILFGIIGERWETQWPEFRQLNLVNEHWTRPLLEETPGWAKGYDKNSYW